MTTTQPATGDRRATGGVFENSAGRTTYRASGFSESELSG
jgi:hypothetical protein